MPNRQFTIECADVVDVKKEQLLDLRDPKPLQVAVHLIAHPTDPLDLVAERVAHFYGWSQKQAVDYCNYILDKLNSMGPSPEPLIQIGAGELQIGDLITSINFAACPTTYPEFSATSTPILGFLDGSNLSFAAEEVWNPTLLPPGNETHNIIRRDSDVLYDYNLDAAFPSGGWQPIALPYQPTQPIEVATIPNKTTLLTMLLGAIFTVRRTV